MSVRRAGREDRGDGDALEQAGDYGAVWVWRSQARALRLAASRL